MLDSSLLMQRELSTFPLAPNYLHKLSSADYNTVDDLKDVSPTELSEGKFDLSTGIPSSKFVSLAFLRTLRAADSAHTWCIRQLVNI